MRRSSYAVIIVSFLTLFGISRNMGLQKTNLSSRIEMVITRNVSNSSMHTDKARLMKEWKNFRLQSEKENATRSQEEVPYKRLPDFILPAATVSREDIVLATHMSIGETNKTIHRLQILQRFWQGPISVAVLITSPQDIRIFMDFLDTRNMVYPLTVHFLLENRKQVASTSFAAQYPHNRLRNMALHSDAIPDFVLGVDLDFIPTFEGYPKLKNLFNEHPDLWNQMRWNKTLFVLPVLEVHHVPCTKRKKYNPKSSSCRKANNDKVTEGDESDLPHSREELKVLFDRGWATKWHSAQSQAPSNLTHYWTYQPGITKGKTYPIVPTTFYEPYFLGYKPVIPKYWEAFRGYGMNKQSHGRECLLAGLQMKALYEFYVTHLAHKSRKNLPIRRVNDKIWREQFQPYLKETYGRTTTNQGELWFLSPRKIDNATTKTYDWSEERRIQTTPHAILEQDRI